MKAYFNGHFLSKEDVRISPDDRGFVFADGVYEFVRAYNGRFFRMDEHLRRLSEGLKAIRISGVDVRALDEAARQLLVENGFQEGAAAVYMQVTRGEAPRAHAFPEPAVGPTVYAAARQFQTPHDLATTGINVSLIPDLRWARCDIKTLMLLPNVLACQQARERGAQEGVFVRDGMITEGSHSNICAVLDGGLRTAPADRRILPGVTRGVVLKLCADLGIPVKESAVSTTELTRVQELMALSTTFEVMPVVQADDVRIGDGKPGPITQKLQAAFRALT